MVGQGTHEALPDERNEDIIVYVNGEFYRRDEAKISVFDSGFWSGTGYGRVFGCTMASSPSWIYTSTVSWRVRRR